MFSSKTKRVFVAAALAAALSGTVPAQAADWSAAPADLLDRLLAWVVEIWVPEAPAEGGFGKAIAADGVYIDPNGGGPKTGSCDNDPGCNAPKEAVAAGRP
jgi:hypothetical protein